LTGTPSRATALALCKVSPVAEHYHWLHSLDRLKIAQRLNEQRPVHLPPLQVCLQIKLRDVSRDKQDETPATIKMRQVQPAAA
jgi:uncharacterized pyridoxal phosphate-containing UPF0001 family protein